MGFFDFVFQVDFVKDSCLQVSSIESGRDRGPRSVWRQLWSLLKWLGRWGVVVGGFGKRTAAYLGYPGRGGQEARSRIALRRENMVEATEMLSKTGNIDGMR